MWPYVVMIVLPIYVQHMRLKGTTIYIARPAEGNNSKAIKMFFGILLVLLMLRHESVGIDLKNYKFRFEYNYSVSWQTALGRSPEIAYAALNKLISSITLDFRWMLVAVSLLSILPMSVAYAKYSSDAGLTVSLFVTMTNFILLFSGLRQIIAIAIGFIAFECTKRKNLSAFILVVVVAMLFHTSAFMLSFMYPLYHVRVTKKWLFWVIPAMLVVFVFNRQIFGLLTAILSLYTKYEGEISSTGAYTMLILYAIFAVFAYVIPDEDKMDNDTIAMRNYLLLAVVLQMFAPLHNLAMRMNYYYMAFIPLLIPRVIACRSKRWGQVAIVARHIMVVFFVTYFFVTAPKDNSLHTFPYYFFWQEIP